MALAPVRLPEALRPWHNAGLRYILPAGTMHTALPDEANPDNIELDVAPPDSAHVPSQRKVAANLSDELKPGDFAPGLFTRTPEEHIRTNPVPANRIPGNAGTVEIPRDWQDILSRTKTAPLLWSYHELGLDLCGAGSSARGNFFRKLLQDLNLPKGSSSFWPTALPDPDPARRQLPRQISMQNSNEEADLSPHLNVEHSIPELLANAAAYQAGLARLGPRAIVLLGAEGLRESGLPDIPLFQHILVSGRMLLHLPDPAPLMADQTQYQVALAFLRSALAFVC